MKAKNTKIDRREMLKSLSLATGFAFTVGATSAFISGCRPNSDTEFTPTFFSKEEYNLLDELSECIIPKTDTPGAKDVQVARYMDEAVKNNYKAEDQVKIKEGLKQIDEMAREKYKKKFASLKPEAMDDILKSLAEQAKKTDDPHIFKELKSLTISGFASSEVGATQFFKHMPLPGPYKGCVDYSTIGKNIVY